MYGVRPPASKLTPKPGYSLLLECFQLAGGAGRVLGCTGPVSSVVLHAFKLRVLEGMSERGVFV